MDELQIIGDFNLYDRVRIKNTNITGNIVLIYDNKVCEIEYDAQFRKNDDEVIYMHNVNELEHE